MMTVDDDNDDEDIIDDDWRHLHLEASIRTKVNNKKK